ncbi:MAG TPA: class D sortase [Acidimicrobiales bacterium]
MSSSFHLSRPRGGLVPWILITVGLVFLAGAGVWQLRESLWMSNYHRVGSSLTQQEESRIAAARLDGSVAGTAGSSNSAPSGSTATPSLDSASKGSGSAVSSCAQRPTSGPQGLLKFPELGVVAPIEQGSTDSVLAVAVGHDPSSVWPGTNGTAVFLSHDVTYFVNIGHLKQNDIVSYVSPCASYTYKVSTSKVVLAGTTIYNSPGSTIDLVTCYPSNALFYTNQRLVVSLSLVKASVTKTWHPLSISDHNVPTLDARQPTVPVPPQLAAQGLTLATDYAPMGTLTILGTPDSRYVQSPAALLAQDAALVAYFGGIKTLAEGHLDWWKQFAPHVSPPSALIGHTIGGYTSAVNVYIEASNLSIRGVIIRDDVRIGGSSYAMQIGMAISSKNVLTITSWKV